MTVTKEKIIEELQTIFDPEVHVDIWTMGLIYDIQINNDAVHFVMTYTTPLCPAGPLLQQEIQDAMAGLGFKKVTIEITFEPSWKIPEGLREMLGV